MLTKALILVFALATAHGQGLCPTGWESWGRSCYWFSDESFTFAEARKLCQARGGDLTSIATVAERDFLTNNVAETKVEMWMGLNQINVPQKSGKWVDGTVWDQKVANWAPGEPNNRGGNEDCGSILSSGKWNDNVCTTPMRFICKRPDTFIEKCDVGDGWHALGNMCYKRFDELLEWRDARDKCKDNQGDLMVIDSPDKITYLRSSIVCKDRDSVVWLGLSDTSSPGTLKWVDGQAVTVQSWYDEEPKMRTNGDSCTEAVSASEYKWRIAPCRAQKRFMCQKPQGRCPRGWRQWHSKCYRAFAGRRVKLSWTDADKRCKSFGGNLLQINSPQETNGVVRRIADNLLAGKVNYMWFGISDRNSDGIFTWSDNTDITYKNWADGQPENTPKRMDCGYIPTAKNTNPNTRKWRTGYCFSKQAFVCQLPLGRQVGNNPLAATHECMVRGWRNFKDQCYSGERRNINYADAQKACKQKGADLAVIPDEDVQSFISYSLNIDSWIGGRRVNGKWVWQGPGNNQEPVFVNWANGEPSSDAARSCMFVQGGRTPTPGQWKTMACNQRSKGYICQKKASEKIVLPSVPPTLPSSPNCPSSSWAYDPVSQFCYQINFDRQKWGDARKKCQQRGADLVSLGDLHEQSFVSGLVTITGYLHFWTGGNRLGVRKGWRWSDGTPFRFINWNPGSPNRWRCMDFQPNQDSRWVSTRCAQRFNYVCKKASKLSTTLPPAVATVAPAKCKPEPMMSGAHYIQDFLLTAKSMKPGAGPERSRLNTRAEGSLKGGWMPMINNNNQWIQADFQVPIVVYGISTQGTQASQSWVKSFRLRTRYDEAAIWKWMWANGKIIEFDGNQNADEIKLNRFPWFRRAQYWRLYPMEWNGAVGLRWEFVGCIQEDCRAENLITGPGIRPDNALRASSSFDGNHGPQNSRIGTTAVGLLRGGWAARPGDRNPWIQVDLGQLMRIKGVITQGRSDKDQWVTKYKVSYGADGKNFTIYEQPYMQQKEFDGNKDRNTQKRYNFNAPFVARYVRVHPTAWKDQAALRWEVIGCLPGCEPIGLISGKHRVRDRQLTASSSLDSYHRPARSRIGTRQRNPFAGAWVAKFADRRQWLQVNFGTIIKVRAIATRGRNGKDQWTSEYFVSYSMDNGTWYTIEERGKPKKFQGNWDRDRLLKNYLSEEISAQYVRIWPQKWAGDRPALRWEIYGCPGPLSGQMVGCYADSWRVRDLPYAVARNPAGGMTTRYCINHCYHRGYMFAGLQNGAVCYCGNEYGQYGPSNSCNKNCTGDPRDICGGKLANSVHSTGLGAAWERCPDGWHPFQDNCYQIMRDPKSTYAQASQRCMDAGGSLATINSRQDMMFTLSMMRATKEDMWIGLNDLRYVRLFEWVDGQPVRYTNWGWQQPQNNPKARCIYQRYQNGRWLASGCFARKSFLCSAPKSMINTPVTPRPQPGCDAGWMAYGYSCYLFSPSAKQWKDAKSECEGFQGTLVRVDDRYEQAFLSAELSTLAGQYWTDLSDVDSPGNYKFSDGSAVIPYTNWGKGQPDDRTGGCVVMETGNLAGLWFDRNCTVNRQFICKKLRDGYTRPPPYTTSMPDVPCTQGWEQKDANCFQVNKVDSSEMLTWQDALDNCRNKGADLASFHSKKEMDYIWQYFMSGTPQNFWIGLNSLEAGKGHQWSDGSAVQFTNWAPGEPNSPGTENCVEAYSSDGKWNDMFCTRKRNWICKIPRGKPVIPPSTTVAPTAGPPGLCENYQWKYYNGKCYYLTPNYSYLRRIFTEAEKDCVSKGANLVSIHSQEEQLYIHSQVRQTSQAVMWIGLNELDITDGYKWTDGSPTDYTNWAPGEPNNADGNEACVHLKGEDGMWNDVHCSDMYGYICAKDKDPKPPRTPAPELQGNCPAGYEAFRNKCFQFNDGRDYNTQKYWTDARKACTDQGNGNNYRYDLASIADDKEQAFITAHIKGASSNVWIGMKKIGGKFKWIDNSDVTYTNWFQGEPSSGPGEECVEMWYGQYNGGKWNDARCYNRQGYICQTYKQPEIATPAPTTNTCPRDFTPYGNSCYLLIRSSRSWNDAKSYCEQQEALLTSINDRFEQAYIYSLMNIDKLNSAVWIGLSDKVNPGHFLWVDNWPIRYVNWGTGQPDYQKGGCVQLGTDGKWSDVACETRLPAVCKKTDEKPPATPVPKVGACPEATNDRAWISYGTSCYYFNTKDERSAIEADFECNNMGARLASIQSDDEAQFAAAQMAADGKRIWIGLFKTPSNGFEWRDGSPVGYTNWAPGEPSDKDGNGGEHCTEMLIDGKWNDAQCYLKWGYVCKLPQVMEGSTVTIPDRTPGRSSTTDAPGPTNPPSPTMMPTGSSGVTVRSTTSQGGPDKRPVTSGSASGAEIAAIVLAVLAIIGLFVFIITFFRREKQKQVPKIELDNGDSAGFDNVLYAGNGGSIQVT